MNNDGGYLLFCAHDLLRSGDLLGIALACKAHRSDKPLLIFEVATGRQIDIDVRGSQTALASRYGGGAEMDAPPVRRGRGRPRLGVTGREVTLLPRHWEWLDTQRGGASASLRRLVDEARRTSSGSDAVRLSQDRTHRFLTAIAGNLPGFEEATRALFAGDGRRFRTEIRSWPRDVRHYALEFARDALNGEAAA